MNRVTIAILVLLLSLTWYAQLHQGRARYWNPTGPAAQTHNPNNERVAQSYPMGVLDITQDFGQTCAPRAAVLGTEG